MCLTKAKKNRREKNTEKKLKNYAETYILFSSFCSVVFNIEQLKFHEKSGIHTLRTHVKSEWERARNREKKNECVFLLLLLLLSNLYKKFCIRKLWWLEIFLLNFEGILFFYIYIFFVFNNTWKNGDDDE